MGARLSPMTHANAITAYYDDLCPICRHEMGAYVNKAPDLIRLHDCNGELPADIDRDAALASLHVRMPDGRVETGWSAFLAIWERMPEESRGLRWLARLTRPALIRIVLNQLYLWLAPLRPRDRCRDGVCERPN
jgi:predicted DCC family thiol-disulfide oxidoreductase YuxK